MTRRAFGQWFEMPAGDLLLNHFHAIRFATAVPLRYAVWARPALSQKAWSSRQTGPEYTGEGNNSGL